MSSVRDMIQSMLDSDNLVSQAKTGTASGAGSAKEKEGIAIASSETALRDISGQEIDLPKEVSAAGVKVQSTVVPLPPTMSQMGVKPAGVNVSLGTGATVSLPLSDDQIVQGLHQDITTSWRWMAEWCVRKLKQLHLVFKYIHGKLVRVKS